MRSLGRLAFRLAVGGAAWGISSAAFAQAADINPRLPNVLLVVDTAGNMAMDPAGSVTSPDCRTGNPVSRWALVVQALTGSIPPASLCCRQGGSCSSSCSSGVLQSNGVCAQQNPGGLTFGSPSDWPTLGTGPIDKRDAICFVAGGSCQNLGGGNNDFNQQTDGLLDSFGKKIRFGLITGDNGRGADVDWQTYGDTWIPADANNVGDTSQYSYWWNGGGNWMSAGPTGQMQGQYAGAAGGLVDWEVGGRNRNAEPWRGRMMGFGNDAATIDDVALQNERIQKVLLALGPQYEGFGTLYPHPGDLSPAAALLSDTYDFLANDGDILTNYPTSATASFLMSPAGDTAFTGGCRGTDVVFVTGGPFGNDMRNMDSGLLRLGSADGYDSAWAAPTVCTPNPFPLPPTCTTPPAPTKCTDAGGVCPYQPTLTASRDATAYYLSAIQTLGPAGRKVAAHVVGMVKNKDITVRYASLFACPAGASPNGINCKFDCESVTAASFNPGGVCEPKPIDFFHPFGYEFDGGAFADPAGVVAACCDVASLQAYLPATEKIIFANDLSELKAGVANIVARSIGGTTSRTQPAYGVAASTLVPTRNPTSSGRPPASFEMLSSLRAAFNTAPSTAHFGMWRGFLERRRLACDSSAQPTPLNISTSSGDDFGDNIQQFGHTNNSRKFFTVSARSGSKPVVKQSLRFASNVFGFGNPASDGLNSVNVSNTNLITSGGANRDPIGANALASTMDGIPGPVNSDDLLGITNADKNKCKAEFSASGGPYWPAKDCADRALKWYGGIWTGVASDRCDPSYSGCQADVANVNSYPLGAIYHSTPVVVGPPSDGLTDEEYRSSFAVVPTSATPNGQATRPTMEYAQTIDGQLHAFVVANNSAAADTVKYNSGVPDADGSQLQELWTFIPPIVLPSIWPNFNAHAVLLDGPITVSDIIPRRSAAAAQAATSTATSGGSWRTILVGSGGASALGGFYYSLDVTDPRHPKFLWQLSTAGLASGGNNSPVALFGDSVPGAAIATVGLETSPGVVDQVAVAILSGGMPNGLAPTGTPVARRCSGCVHSGVRGTIRDWGANVPSRSVTIVKLLTGEVIKRFEGNSGYPGDLPATDTSLLSSKRDDTNALDSPMSGTPVVFPNTPGVQANRAYVGDADGTMWRIDLSGKNPGSWTIDIAYDAYGNYWNTTAPVYSGTSTQPLVGEPSVTPPVVSVDDNGETTVSYATGSQEGFQAYSPDMDTELVTFNDRVGGGVARFQRSFANGERVTGPLTLFGDNLYYASFTPANAAPGTCNNGQAHLWGVDFLAGTNQLDTNGDGIVNGSDSTSIDFGVGEVIIGVQVNRVPSCYGSAVTITDDAWLGGSYKSVSSSSASNYELTVQTGQGQGTTGSMADDLSGDTTSNSTNSFSNSFHVKLPVPKTLVTLRSWASISD